MNAVVLKFFKFLDYGVLDPEEIEETAGRTGFIVTMILLLLGAFLLISGSLLVYSYLTSKKRRAENRFERYRTTAAKITDIEKVSYYVKPYEREKEVKFVDEYIRIGRGGRDGERKNEIRIRSLSELNYLTARHETMKSINSPRTEAVEKFRYKVKYEFSTDSSNLYSGEFYIFEEKEDIKVGKTIDIKYNPANPMMNFSSYSEPVGMR